MLFRILFALTLSLCVAFCEGCGRDALAQNYAQDPVFDQYVPAGSTYFVSRTAIDMNSTAAQVIYTVPPGLAFVPTQLLGTGGTALANTATVFAGRNGGLGNVANVASVLQLAPAVLAGFMFTGYSGAMAPLLPGDTINLTITTGTVSGTRNAYLFGNFFPL